MVKEGQIEKGQEKINLNKEFDEIEKEILELRQLKPKELEKRADDLREEGYWFMHRQVINGKPVVPVEKIEEALLSKHKKILEKKISEDEALKNEAFIELPREYGGRGNGGSILLSPDGRGLIKLEHVGGSNIDYKFCKQIETKEILENTIEECDNQIGVLTESKNKCDAVVKKIEKQEE